MPKWLGCTFLQIAKYYSNMQVRFCGSPDYFMMFIVVVVNQGSFVISLFILIVEVSLPDVSVSCPPSRKTWKCLSHVLLVVYCTGSNIDPKLAATQRLFPCNFLSLVIMTVSLVLTMDARFSLRPQSAQILQGIIDLSVCFSVLFSPFAVNDICAITGLMATISVNLIISQKQPDYNFIIQKKGLTK